MDLKDDTVLKLSNMICMCVSVTAFCAVFQVTDILQENAWL